MKCEDSLPEESLRASAGLAGRTVSPGRGWRFLRANAGLGEDAPFYGKPWGVSPEQGLTASRLCHLSRMPSRGQRQDGSKLGEKHLSRYKRLC